MFQKIRYRLLFSYLAVLTITLGVFAITVQITFANSLREELAERLAILAEAASGELDLEEELEVDGADLLLNSSQAVQWFDTQGRLIDQRGDDPLTLPLNPKQTFQTQTLPPAQGVTLPVTETEKNGELIGYVRVSESLEELYGTLRRLDWGLGGGVVLALALSGLGGTWLTRQAMQPVEQSFQRLQRFTSDASHELRSPLMALKTNAAVALKYPEGMRDSDAEKFQAIASASTQLTALTENLLLLARTDQTIRTEEIVDIKALLGHLLDLYQFQVGAKQIQLKAQLKPGWVKGDNIQLTQLFTNLVDNALRYTSAGGIVEVQTNLERAYLTVSVEDTGIGIAAEHIEHIFDRFWQADQARSYQAGGFGLGLAIAQGIAQNHGGSITVTSQLGAGSCFTVRLPVDSL